MIIRISPDLSREDIWANGNNLSNVMGMDQKKGVRIRSYPLAEKRFVHSFKNPVLMTDNHRISKLPFTLRETLFSLFQSRPRIIEYDGVSVSWTDQHPSVWCPSIDTMLYAQGLNRLFSKRKDFKTAVEIGCGSGFLSKYVLAKLPGLKSILVNDLNPEAVDCARENISDSRAHFLVGNGLEKIPGKKFDLLLCNPPYVPRPNSIDDNPYEGVGLLHHLLHEGQQYLNPNGVMIVNISSLCKSIVLNEKPSSMKLHILSKKEVPLKVNNILNNQKWMTYLHLHGLKKKKRADYPYWQKLEITAFERGSYHFNERTRIRF